MEPSARPSTAGGSPRLRHSPGLKAFSFVQRWPSGWRLASENRVRPNALCILGNPPRQPSKSPACHHPSPSLPSQAACSWSWPHQPAALAVAHFFPGLGATIIGWPPPPDTGTVACWHPHLRLAQRHLVPSRCLTWAGHWSLKQSEFEDWVKIGL